MKKLTSLLLAFAMLFSLAMPAMAADISGNTSGWSTYGTTGDEPTVTGNKEGNVTAIYTPVISVSDIILSASYNDGCVTVDEANKTYFVTIPAGEPGASVTATVKGTNLDKASEYDEIRISVAGLHYAVIGSAVQNGEYQCNILLTPDNTGLADLQYSFDAGVSWTNTGWKVVVRQGYAVTIDENIANGTVTADKAFAAEGDTVTLNVTPAEGYELSMLAVAYGEGEDVTDLAITNNTFTMPAGNVTVTATFQQATETYTVTVDENIANGTVAVNPTTYTAGQTVTLAVNPDEGYVLDQLTVTNTATDEPVTVTGTSFVMPAANVTVTATFKKVYTITTAFEGEGAVSADKTSAAEGETVTVTFTPGAGYALFEIYAYEPNNGENTVELKQVDVSTYTFTMPAHPVHINGLFVKNGKAREDLYFNNGGNTDWTDVYACFYTDTGSFIDSVFLTMAENGVYTIPEDEEIPNLAYKVYFGCDSGDTEMVDIPTDEANMFTLGTTTNEYDQYKGTWSKYTPSQPPVGTTSAEIIWGSLAYTYSDETGEWTTDGSEGAGTVTVKNTGDNAFNAQPLYTAKEGYTEITGHFYESMDAAVTTMYADLYSGGSFTFYLKLKNKPSKALNGDTIATVTIRITEGIGE